MSPATTFRKRPNSAEPLDAIAVGPDYVDAELDQSRRKLIPLTTMGRSVLLPGHARRHHRIQLGGQGQYERQRVTAQADVWGIFGQQGLNIGNRWTTPAAGTPTYLAMKLWRNYDNAGHGFGDVSTYASAPNPDQVSCSRRSSDGALVVSVINKNLYDSGNPGVTTAITVNLNHFAGTGTAQFSHWRRRTPAIRRPPRSRSNPR